MATRPTFKLDTKRKGNFIAVYFVGCNGYIRRIGILEVPADERWRDDVEFLDLILDAFRKRIRKSIF